MTAEPLLADLQSPQRANLARRQVERLVSERLTGRRIDVVTFVEGLLAVATQVGEVNCNPAADRALRFQLPGGESFQVDLDSNRGKLRMICARLALLCQENLFNFLPYGGEGVIRRSAKTEFFGDDPESLHYSLLWKAHWKNAPGEQEFTITVPR